MPAPEPMLSSSARQWPAGGEWVLQPKWDGFRLLVEVTASHQIRGWSRHGTNLTDRLGSLLAAFDDVPAGSVFDGELVALAERDGQPVQDFAAVTRAVFTAAPAATRHVHFIAFDLLHHGSQDLRPQPWRVRDERLRLALPISERVRAISTQPATAEAHDAIVALGFEGTVLKRPRSAYRPGRSTAWVKHKARCAASALLVSVHQDRDGAWQAICDVDGRRVRALAGVRSWDLVGEEVAVVYSRVDAGGGLREARLAARRPL